MPRLIARCRAAWTAFRTAEGVDPAPDAHAPVTPDRALSDPDIPRYPPFLKGLPVASTEQILDTQGALIAELQDALAFGDTDYGTLVRPLLARYAAFVHLLPASETHHHRGAGGLLRHGLEVAFHAARASRGRLFALDRLPAERRILEPRWHLAAAVAGLLHDVGKPVADLSVVDQGGTQRWQPLDESLIDWASGQGIARYFLRWNNQRLHQGHELFTSSLLQQLLTREVRHWLMDPDPRVWLTLSRVLAGMDDQALLGELVRTADRISVEQDLRENRLDPDAFSLGVPIERYLIDTMRTLLRDSTWTVNVPGARVWILPPNSLHLVWPGCAEDCVQRLVQERIPSIPRDPDTLADILIERHLARPRPLGEGTAAARYWRFAPAILARDPPLVLSFLRLAAPELLFSGVVPPATPVLAIEGDSAPTDPAGPETAVMDSPLALEPRATAEPSEAEGGDDQGRGTEVVVLSRPPSVAESHSGQDAARDWLSQQGEAGPLLLTLAEAFREHRLTSDAHPLRVRDRLFLPYPQAFSSTERKPAEQLELLVIQDWIERDPLRPLLKVREHEGRSGVWLTRTVSRRLMDLGVGSEWVSGLALEQPPPDMPAQPSPEPPTTATDYARSIRQRLLARDPTLGPIREQPGALSVPLRGPILEGARRAGLSEIALRRALERLPKAHPVTKGILTLGL